jgi:hypothetical protein
MRLLASRERRHRHAREVMSIMFEGTGELRLASLIDAGGE